MLFQIQPDADGKEITFGIIKPDAVHNNAVGPIIHRITDAGFRIVAMKMTSLRPTQAEKFYQIHKDRPFFPTLVEYMCSGPVVALVLEKVDAIADFRALIGATNPLEAEPNCLRRLFGTDKTHNALHGSDSIENALREASFYFPLSDMFDEHGINLG